MQIGGKEKYEKVIMQIEGTTVNGKFYGNDVYSSKNRNRNGEVSL